MYKTFTRSEFKQLLGLPENYSISGFLSYGSWNIDDHLMYFDNTLKQLGIKYKHKKLTGFLQNIYEVIIAKKCYWFAMHYGSATLSEYSHLACILGSTKNIHIGSCGGLYPKINSCDLIIPKWSYGNESSTRLYGRNIKDHKHFPNRELSEKIKKKINKDNKIWSGPIITCQAMLGETWDDVREWSKKGFYGVEMETSTLFAVSNHFKVPSSALLYVSDNLIKKQVVGDESHIRQKELRRRAKREIFKIAIETLLDK